MANLVKFQFALILSISRIHSHLEAVHVQLKDVARASLVDDGIINIPLDYNKERHTSEQIPQIVRHSSPTRHLQGLGIAIKQLQSANNQSLTMNQLNHSNHQSKKDAKHFFACSADEFACANG